MIDRPDYRARIIQNEVQVASVQASSKEAALHEIGHYAALYSQEGTIRIEVRSGKGRWRELLP